MVDAILLKKSFHSALLFLALSAVAYAAPVTPPANSNQLAASDWQEIRRARDIERYRATPSGAGYFAHNPTQGWAIRFDGQGFGVEPQQSGWTWGLALTAYGVDGSLHTVGQSAPRVTAEAGRVAYEWSAGVEEWFVNDSRGLEHGYTLATRPAGEGDGLRFRLAVRGGLRPVAGQEATGVDFVDASGATIVTYNGLKAWDVDGRTLPSRLSVDSDGELMLSVDDRQARYPVTVDPLAQQAYLKASNPDSQDWFGHAVAVSGDTVVVSAIAEDGGGSGVNPQPSNTLQDSGAVYVFVRTNGVWSQQAYIKASNPSALDQFGYSVAISGNTLVVGAPGEDSNGSGVNPNTQGDNPATDSGAAYVFLRTGSSWAQQAYLKASNPDANDLFGWSVGVSGDTAVVGALREASNSTVINSGGSNNSAASAGAAYVFHRTGSSWSQQAYLKASNTGANDELGWSVAISGDTIVVGAPLEDSNGTGVNSNTQNNNQATDAGAAYVFTRSGAAWSQQAYLKASNTGAEDAFGYAVSVNGDDIVVGAVSEDSNGTGVNSNTQGNNAAPQSGAAYVFHRTGSTWAQQAYLKASNTEEADQFGWSVGMGFDAIVVGAPNEDGGGVGANPANNNNSTDSGAVYYFRRNSGVWSQDTYLKASNTGFQDNFGRAVAIDGSTVAAGAHREDSNGSGVSSNTQANNSLPNSGAAYIFSSGSGPSVVSASPRAGVGNRQVFELEFSDPDGWQDLGVLNLLINNFLDGRDACYLAYSQPANVLYLVDDAGSSLQGVVFDGQSNLSNSQCTVHGATSSASGSGTSFTLRLDISFTSGFAGDKILHVAARDQLEQGTPWIPMGVWRTSAQLPPVPTVVSVVPNAVNGQNFALTVTYQRATGDPFTAVQILINKDLDGRNACYIGYNPDSNNLYLVDDDGGTLLGPANPGSVGTLSNSQCTLNMASSSGSIQGNQVILTLSYQLTNLPGQRIVYAAGQTVGGGNSGWQSVGAVTAP